MNVNGRHLKHHSCADVLNLIATHTDEQHYKLEDLHQVPLHEGLKMNIIKDKNIKNKYPAERLNCNIFQPKSEK